MRRARSNRAILIIATLAAFAGGATRVKAQTGLAQEGALFLLLPVGARSVGMGQAVAADRSGSESVWWNPAAIGAATRREAAIHHSQSVVGTGDAVTLIIPSSLLGVIAASVNILDYGEQEANPDPTQPADGVGTIIPRSFVYAATYATGIGRYVTAGITYKVVQFRIDCTGPCPDIESAATTSALDVGAQFAVGPSIPILFGVAVRNLGLKLQVNDNPQSDPIPRRIHVGAQYRVAIPERYVPQTEVRLGVDVLDELESRNPAARVGTNIAYRDRVHFRAGYAFETTNAESGGAALGLGFNTGSLMFDVARIFSGLSADAGQAPTYLSLRYLF